MCGFSGVVLKKSNKKLSDKIELSLDKVIEGMNHRGPDDNGKFTHENIYLTHNRLSIIDLSETGKQPMIDYTGQYVIVFNGEIYNYELLYNKYFSKNDKINSKSDTSILIEMYKKFGKDCLNQLNGMFAFAIINLENNEIFLARDRFGEKPLYWINTDDYFAFSSELSGLRNLLPNLSLDINQKSLFYYLTNGYVPSPFTIYENINMLDPANFIEIKNFQDIIKSEFYWNLIKHDDTPVHDIENKIKNLFKQSVKSRLTSDVDVGMFLSGGIDSGSIMGACEEIGTPQKNALILDFDEKEFSEYEMACVTASHYNGIVHRKIVSSTDFEEILEDFFEKMDQPTIDGFNTFFVSKYAKEFGLKVWLSGVGGDEMFGGYSSFRHLKPRAKLSSFLQIIPDNILNFLANNVMPLNLKKNRILQVAMNGNPFVRAFQSLRGSFPVFNAKKIMLKGNLFSAKDLDNIYPKHDLANLSYFNKSSLLETKLYMGHQLLRDIDNFSMAHSIEIRAPFLNHDLFQFVFNLDDKFKYSSKTIKILLTKALEKRLPDKIINQPKKGFGFPVDTWIRTKLKDKIYATLFDTRLEHIWDFDYLDKIWKGYLNGKINWDSIWAIYSFNRWYLINH